MTHFKSFSQQTSRRATSKGFACRCNHLTAFGGEVLVAPNPIDFDKVLAGFANIDDNPTVLATIIFLFLLYFLGVMWAKRKDARDKEYKVMCQDPNN